MVLFLIILLLTSGAVVLAVLTLAPLYKNHPSTKAE